MTANTADNLTDNMATHPTTSLTSPPPLLPSDQAIEVSDLGVLDVAVRPQDQEAGIFRLTEKPALDTRSGASVSSWEDDVGDPLKSDLDSPLDDDFPMVVWLRGDESWYPQFDLDADTVMARLGIKRSRLTQISGKELRVGRVRIDRYIKPVFRSHDVESYLRWTRATASHQKSSSAIKDATQALQSQGEQIAQIVAHASVSFSDALKSGLLIQLEEASTRSIASLAQETKNLQTNIEKMFEKAKCNDQVRAEVLGTQLSVQDIRLNAIENNLAAVVLRLAETSDRLLHLSEQQIEASITIQALAQVLDNQNQILSALKPKEKAFTRQRVRRVNAKIEVTEAATAGHVRPKISRRKLQPSSH
ncbi:MAG: hypothetical protein NTV34_04945 [Proteobacteria bacterium]|nr:hypothetical protein [Pseudomonadota bacterium]